MKRLSIWSLALLGGVLVAVGVPPLGIWPAMLVGIACYVMATERRGSGDRSTFMLGALFAWGWLAPAMGWMWHLVPGGFVVAPLLFAVFHGVAARTAAWLTPREGSSLTQRIVVLSLAHTLAECLRYVAPFGGVPLAGMALGVADTRLSHLVRVVGPLGMSLWVFLAGGVLAELLLRRHEHGWGSRRPALALLAVLVVAQMIAQIAPTGRNLDESLRIAVVQGGGPQGVLAINSNPRDVIDRHLAATRLLDDGPPTSGFDTASGVDAASKIDLVLWPENTVDVRDFTESRVRSELQAEALRIGAPFAVGITEDAGDNFTNAQVVMNERGEEISRYDKVRRVPYGEYVPLRNALQVLGAPVDRIPRDAIAGATTALIEVPKDDTDVPLAVAISWEVFFSGRVLEGVRAGGRVVLNPTNGSSYTGEILQQQQVATSQLRALETGRWVVQAATTGYSIFVDPDGHVLDRIPIGKQAVMIRDVPLRTGRTIYSYLGDNVVTAVIVAMMVAAVLRSRRRTYVRP
ncbi:MAG: apolipoprotein N-acyltransferase [Ilumatobacteraceae bacterium]